MNGNPTIRDATPADAPFLALCVMAGMHFHDFEAEIPEDRDIYEGLVGCEKREDLLYSYVRTRVAEVDGKAVGSLLSYPGDMYLETRDRTFAEIWPEFFEMTGDPETDPGEYYLDSMAVLPECRGRGIGRALMRDAMRKGFSLGYKRIALVVDSSMPRLISLYGTLGFVPDGHRHAFGVDFLRMVCTVD